MAKEAIQSKAEKIAAFASNMNSKFKKTYGGDVLYKSSGVGNFKPLQTGFPNFDWINSGIGGFPRGGMTLIHGPESTGKTTFCLDAISFAMAKDPNLYGMFLDVESSITEDFLRFKKIDPTRMEVTCLNTEDGLIIAENAIKEDIYDFIIIDSLAKLESSKILEKEMGESAQRNRRAVLITDFLRRITFILRRSNTALICINQEIENQDRRTPYDPKTVLPGGKQQKYSANLRIELKRSLTIKDGEKKIGYKVGSTSAKNKIASREKAYCEFTYLYDRGFVREIALIDYLVDLGYLNPLHGKRFEFKEKNWYDKPFKIGEINKIQKQIKEVLGVDLYDIKPSDNFKFKVNEQYQEAKAEDETIHDSSAENEDINIEEGEE